MKLPKKRKGLRTLEEKRTVITTHRNTDLDALGAVIGVSKLYPGATVVLPDTKGADVLKVLEENPELLDYEEESKFRDSFDRLVVVDTDSLERIPKTLREKVSENTEVIVFDHHSKNFDFPVKEIFFKGSGAVTSLITLILKGKGIVPSPLEASVMLAGIYSDTGSFKYPNTTPLDFLAAAFLLSCGANLSFVKKYLPKELTEEELSYLKLLTDNLEIYEINGNRIGLTYLRLDDYVGDVSHLLSKLLEISSLPALVGLIEVGKTTFIIGRSQVPRVDVSKVVSPFGGGGHKEAASATVKNKTVFELLEEVKTYLPYAVKPLRKASDIMTSPPIVVKEEATVEEAKTLLVKNGINAMPVVDEEGKVVGIVNRSLVDKAIYMGLEKEKVESVMERDFYSVSPDTPISEVEKIIVEKHQSFVPVLKEGKPVGVITRTDILVNLYKEEMSELEAFYEKRLKKEPKIRNVADKLKSFLPSSLFRLLKDIGEAAESFGVNAYVVGGFVRDLIIGRKNFDIDVVVEGDATLFAKFLAKRVGAKVHLFNRFKTATVIFPDGTRIDFASARTEVYPFPGALPEVGMAPLKKDLMRRDFTINTLAVKLNSKEFGKLIDFFGGLRDIKDRKIRVLHSLSFIEDPTRILRGVRFVVRYRFDFGAHTEKLLKMAVERKLFKTVEGQRIYHELKQIMLENNPLRVLNRLEDYGILSSIFEGLSWNRWKKDLFERLRKVVIWHKLNFPESSVKYYIPYFDALFLREELQRVENYLSNLVFPEKEAKEILSHLRELPFIFKKLKEARKNSEIFKLFEGKKEEFLLLLAAYPEEEDLRERVLSYLKDWKDLKPLVTGKDLIEKFALKPGPSFKEILNKVKYGIIDNEINPLDKEEQLLFVERLINEGKISKRS